MKKALILGLVVLSISGCLNNNGRYDKSERTLLFVGSFTDKKPGPGIKVYEFNNQTGEATLTFTVDSLINSSFLKLSNNGRFLYSVIESQMDYNGKVAAFEVDSLLGKISLLNMKDCGGKNPVHLEISASDEFLINSNYTDPSVSVFKVNSDGTLNDFNQIMNFQGSSLIEGRQESAHIHSSNFSPNQEFLYAQDLGSDKIQVLAVDKSEGKLSLTERPSYQVNPGSGPRHFTFTPDGRYAYGIAELSGKVTAYHYSKDTLVYIEDYLAYGAEQDIYRSADIHVSPDVRFLYASNRGPDEDSIVVFEIQKDGRLALVERVSTGGEHPRNFTLDPSGNFLLVANQFSNNVVVFRRDVETGKLIKLPHEISMDGPSSLQMRTYKINASGATDLAE